MLQGEARVCNDPLPEIVGGRELLEQEVPFGQLDEALRRDADRNRDSLRRFEVHAHGVEREVRLDDHPRSAARHRENASYLERQPLLGFLDPCEPFRGILRLAELEAAEEGRERRMGGPGGGQGLLEELVKAVGRGGRRARPNRFLQDRPAKARRLRVGRLLLSSALAIPATAWTRAFCRPVRGRAWPRAVSLISRGDRKARRGRRFRRDRSVFRREDSEEGRRSSTQHSLLQILGRRFRSEPQQKDHIGEILALERPEGLSPERNVVPFPGT